MTDLALKYISINHETASIEQRQNFVFTADDITKLKQQILKEFDDVNGVLGLSTCNRTEFYFEAHRTSAEQIRDFIIEKYVPVENQLKTVSSLFSLSNHTLHTLKYLLQVSTGLRSAVIGDAQIISQIKDAYKHSLANKNQGSILERSLQAVFKAHKKIINETGFRKGTNSTAYKALKLIEIKFGKPTLNSKKLLIIGAGEIAKEVALYSKKFDFKEVFITNRTESKATELAERFDLSNYNWQKTAKNELNQFDAVISCIGETKSFIHTTQASKTNQKVLIDLSATLSIDSKLGKLNHIYLYNLDQITESLVQNQSKQKEAFASVKSIIEQEMIDFDNWFKKMPLRQFLKAYKDETDKLISEELQKNLPIKLSEEEIKNLVTSISKKMLKKPAIALQKSENENTILQHIDILEKAFI
ncbi:glutamyl-tRNA reductase [Chondrinema litorale]|uniref:glutamyl-tRNA reductase n=1 Tax=Chondrinema litorale TaxID=2994555 RepID=UPI002542F96A|nr:glutamyl-tRNA reductase [Chondrinema litorale]UZR93927.1 glutamyl-tRNA reductase [Chondrinema litorale]